MMRHRKPKYVHEYIDCRDRARIYLRRPGEKRLPLPGPLYSEEFWNAYHAAMKREVRTQSLGADRSKPGSLSTIIAGYYGSAEFKTLAESTKASYRLVLEKFREKHGEKPVAKLETRHINKEIDAIAETPAAANYLRKRLHTVMKWAVDNGDLKTNPVSGAKTVKYKTRGHRTWTEADIESFRACWPDGAAQRTAMELMLHTGLRRSDVVRLAPRNIEGDCFRVMLKKSQDVVELLIPIHPAIMGIVARTPSNAPAFLLTAYGKPRTAKALTNWFRDAAHAAGLPSNSSPHGMRKAACRRLAEAGCTPYQIQAITGHVNLKEIETYTKAVEQKRLARIAIRSLVNADGNGGLANAKFPLADQKEKSVDIKPWEAHVALPTGIEPVFQP